MCKDDLRVQLRRIAENESPCRIIEQVTNFHHSSNHYSLISFIIHASRCKFVGFFAGGEFIDELVYVAVHYCGQVVT